MPFQILRIIAVVSLLAGAAAILTPAGSLPPALRVVRRLFAGADGRDARPSAARRALAFAMVTLAAALCLV